MVKVSSSRSVLALLLLLASGVSSAAAEHFVVDPERSAVRFTIPYLFMIVGEVEGRFEEFKVEAEYDGNDVTAASIRVEIATASVDTDLAARDLGLRGEEFFAAEHHPRITFSSRKIEPAGDAWVMHGKLTMRGVQRDASIHFELLDFEDTLVVLGRTKLNRKEYGIEGPVETADFVIGEQVSVRLHLTLVRDSGN